MPEPVPSGAVASKQCAVILCFLDSLPRGGLWIECGLIAGGEERRRLLDGDGFGDRDSAADDLHDSSVVCVHAAVVLRGCSVDVGQAETLGLGDADVGASGLDRCGNALVADGIQSEDFEMFFGQFRIVRNIVVDDVGSDPGCDVDRSIPVFGCDGHGDRGYVWIVHRYDPALPNSSDATARIAEYTFSGTDSMLEINCFVVVRDKR